MKTQKIYDLIRLYETRIRNIRLEVVKLESEIETLQDVIMDLEDIVREDEIREDEKCKPIENQGVIK